MREWLTQHGADPERIDRLAGNGVAPDVLGFNYYPGFSTLRFDEAGGPVPVEAGADGLDELARTYATRYGMPLMVTETSRGGPLEERRTWMRQSLAVAEELRADGIPLLGYTWFPFTALIDWAYREATTPVDDWLVQMGMVDLVRIPGGGILERHPTALLDDYRAATELSMPPIGHSPASTPGGHG